jgi:hypothetical protein
MIHEIEGGTRVQSDDALLDLLAAALETATSRPAESVMLK